MTKFVVITGKHSTQYLDSEFLLKRFDGNVCTDTVSFNTNHTSIPDKQTVLNIIEEYRIGTLVAPEEPEVA